MKKLLYILLLLPLCVFAQDPAKPTSGTKLVAGTIPNAPTDTYPTGYSFYEQGNFTTVYSIAGRDSISAERRFLKTVHVLSPDSYYLGTTAGWTLLSLGTNILPLSNTFTGTKNSFTNDLYGKRILAGSLIDTGSIVVGGAATLQSTLSTSGLSALNGGLRLGSAPSTVTGTQYLLVRDSATNTVNQIKTSNVSGGGTDTGAVRKNGGGNIYSGRLGIKVGTPLYDIDGLGKFRLTDTATVSNAIFSANFYGDSFWAGIGTVSVANIPTQIATATKWTVTNNAISGQQVPDGANSIYNTSIFSNSVNGYEFGTNDQRNYLTDPNKLAIFTSGHAAELAWLAIPAANKTVGLSSSITYSGTWTNTVAYGIGKASSGTGATATFTATGQNVLIGTIQGNGFGCTYTVTIDGTTMGTYSNSAAATMTTGLGATYGPQLLMYTGLSNTAHTVVITTTNSNTFYLDWYAGVVTGTNYGAKVYVENVTYMTSAGYSTWGGSSSNVDTYNSAIQANITALNAIGLNLVLIDANSVINPATDLSTDGLHPNDSGHTKIANKLLSLIPTNSYAVNAGTLLVTGNSNGLILNTFKNNSIGPNAGVGNRYENEDGGGGANMYRRGAGGLRPRQLTISNDGGGGVSLMVDGSEYMRGSNTFGGIAFGGGGGVSPYTFHTPSAADYKQRGLTSIAYSGSGAGGFAAYNSRGSALYPQSLNNFDEMGGLALGGYDGSNYITGAVIKSGNYQGSMTVGNIPTDLWFNTGSNQASLVNRFHIGWNGNVALNLFPGTAPAYALQIGQSTSGGGTVSVSGTTVTGTRTQFLVDFFVGNTVTVTTSSGSETKAITAIVSNTSMTTASFSGTATNVGYSLPGGVKTMFSPSGATGFGGATFPKSWVQIAASTANTPQLILNPATFSTTLISGAIENNGTNMRYVGSALQTRTFGFLEQANSWTGVQTMASPILTTPVVTGRLTINGSTSGGVSGLFLNSTITPTSNNNVLEGATFQPAFGTGSGILTITITNGGSGYVDGSYSVVALTGGTGTSASANITVSGGVVTAVTQSQYGNGYTAGDVLSAPNTSLGGSGSGLAITVNTLGYPSTYKFAARMKSFPLIFDALTSPLLQQGAIYYDATSLSFKTQTGAGLVDLNKPWVTTTVPAVNGGTGLTSIAIGDMIVPNSTTTFSRVAAVATGAIWSSAGTGTVPTWNTSPNISGSPTTTTQAIGDNSTKIATTAYVDRVKYLRLTGSGTGAATTISIAHGLTGITAASIVLIEPINGASSGISYVTADATNVNIIYTAAPVTGTNNLSYNVSIKP